MNQITLGIAWNRLLAIVEEQAQVLMRTAFSTVVREAGDLSAGIFDTRGRMLAQAVTGTPGHVNSMAESVKRFLTEYPLNILMPGDVLLTNDPWDGTGHLNDFTVVTPVFSDGACIALFASTSHIADVGGRGFGADARDVHEEGLCIPITYLFRAGVRDETLLRIIQANVRDPVVAEGDLYSLTTCNDSGAVGLRRMLVDFPEIPFDQLADHIIETSRTAMRAEVSALPEGTWRYQMMIDGYDQPLLLTGSLTISEGSIHIDFAGSAPSSPWGINVPIAYTTAYAAFAVRCVIGNHIPNNAGSLEGITVVAPEGSVLNAQRPRSVSARHAVGQMLPDVVLGCLAQVIPDRVPAEGASCIWNPVFMDAGETGGNPRVERFVINPIFNGGTGARPGLDGLSATAFPSGVRSTSTEVNEVTSPLVIWRKELKPHSGGEGEYRGGDGQVIEVTHREGAAFRVSKMFDRVHHPARGREGGGDGQPGRVYLSSGTTLRGKGNELVPAGETLVLETPGGGGLGPVSSRLRS